MKRTAVLFTILLTFALGAAAQELPIGGTLGEYTLTDTSGKAQAVSDLKGTNGTVLIFVSAQCPVVRGYNERLNQLALDYRSKGINVVGINANVTESAETVKTHSAQTFKFPVLIDKEGKLTDKLGATHTPEAYFLSPKNNLLYRGAIDDDRSGRAVKTSYLRNAFEASLSGRPIDPTSVNAIGCSIKRSIFDQ